MTCEAGIVFLGLRNSRAYIDTLALILSALMASLNALGRGHSSLTPTAASSSSGRRKRPVAEMDLPAHRRPFREPWAGVPGTSARAKLASYWDCSEFAPRFGVSTLRLEFRGEGREKLPFFPVNVNSPSFLEPAPTVL